MWSERTSITHDYGKETSWMHPPINKNNHVHNVVVVVVDPHKQHNQQNEVS